MCSTLTLGQTAWWTPNSEKAFRQLIRNLMRSACERSSEASCLSGEFVMWSIGREQWAALKNNVAALQHPCTCNRWASYEIQINPKTKGLTTQYKVTLPFEQLNMALTHRFTDMTCCLLCGKRFSVNSSRYKTCPSKAWQAEAPVWISSRPQATSNGGRIKQDPTPGVVLPNTVSLPQYIDVT